MADFSFSIYKRTFFTFIVMDTISTQAKDELFLQVQKQIEKAKIIILQSRKTVEQAKQQTDRLKKELGIYLMPLKYTNIKSLSI